MVRSISKATMRQIADATKRQQKQHPSAARGKQVNEPLPEWKYFRILDSCAGTEEVDAVPAHYDGSAWVPSESDSLEAEPTAKVKGWFLPSRIPAGKLCFCFRHGGTWWIKIPEVCGEPE